MSNRSRGRRRGRSGNKQEILHLTVAGLCLALCMVLPLLTGHIPTIGKALSPMHIPVFLCGFLCGPGYGAAVGAIAPLLRSLIFGMPALYPNAIGMCFELLTYGLISGVLFRTFPRRAGYTYLSLILSMLAGRAVWGVVSIFLYRAQHNVFTWKLFLAGAFTNAVPGIILHLLIIPPLVLLLTKAIPSLRRSS